MKYTIKSFTMKDVYKRDITINVYHMIYTDFSKFKIIVDNEIVDICHADADYEIDTVKKELYSYFKDKSDKQKYGMVAEFFMHILLRDIGYEQRFLFFNLEERSMKKGFDGLYGLDDEFWLAESKCSYTTGTNHSEKISDALSDLRDKIEGKSDNNPWDNAFHHICVSQYGKSPCSFAKKVKDLSIEYAKGIFHFSYEFNLIPCSTLFVNNAQTEDEVFESVKKIVETRKVKSMIVLCIDNNIYDSFVDYIKD